MSAAEDTGYVPNGGARWEFDDEVTRVFDSMLERSIPQYATMRDLVASFGRRFVQPDTQVVDLGCSRGEALASFVYADGDSVPDVQYVGLEVSPPMVDAASARFTGRNDVAIVEHDLRDGIADLIEPWSCSLILSILTLMFVPIEYRPGLVGEIHDRLAPGGALVLVEKLIGSTRILNDTFVDTYYRGKEQAGYSQDEIERKRLSLEGVLVPLTGEMNEIMLRRAGFAEVESFWRCGQFAGWLAVRR